MRARKAGPHGQAQRQGERQSARAQEQEGPGEQTGGKPAGTKGTAASGDTHCCVAAIMQLLHSVERLHLSLRSEGQGTSSSKSREREQREHSERRRMGAGA